MSRKRGEWGKGAKKGGKLACWGGKEMGVGDGVEDGVDNGRDTAALLRAPVFQITCWRVVAWS